MCLVDLTPLHVRDVRSIGAVHVLGERPPHNRLVNNERRERTVLADVKWLSHIQFSYADSSVFTGGSDRDRAAHAGLGKPPAFGIKPERR